MHSLRDHLRSQIKVRKMTEKNLNNLLSMLHSIVGEIKLGTKKITQNSSVPSSTFDSKGKSSHDLNEYQIIWSLINYIAEDVSLVDVLLLNHRMVLLEKSVGQFSSWANQITTNKINYLISLLRGCIHDIRGKLRDFLWAKNVYYNHLKATNYLISITQKINSLIKFQKVAVSSYSQMKKIGQHPLLQRCKFNYFQREKIPLSFTKAALHQHVDISFPSTKLFTYFHQIFNNSSSQSARRHGNAFQEFQQHFIQSSKSFKDYLSVLQRKFHAEGYLNFRKYAQMEASSQKKLLQQVKKLEREEAQQFEILRYKLKNYQTKIATLKKQIQKKSQEPCANKSNCRYSHLRCKRCKQLSSLQDQLSTHEKKTERQHVFSFPKDDKLIHLFYRQLSQQCLELLKIFLYAQNYEVQPNTSSYNEYNQNMLVNDQVQISCQAGNSYLIQFKKLTESGIKSEFKYHSDHLTIKLYGKEYKPIDYQRINRANTDISDAILKKFCENPQQPTEKTREHQIYSNIKKKPACLAIEEYAFFGSARVATITQLPVLLEVIQSRVFNIDPMDKHKTIQRYTLPLNIIWKSVAELASTDFFFQKKQALKYITQDINSFIQQFLQSYCDKWASCDFLSLPILGPIISLLFAKTKFDSLHELPSVYSTEKNPKLPHLSKIFHDILDKVKIEYQRVEDDLNQYKQGQNLTTNRLYFHMHFILTACLSLFCEPIIAQDDPISIKIVLIIVQLKLTKEFLQLNYQQIQTMKKIEFLMEKALNNNITAITGYVKSQPKILTSILKNIDEGITQDTLWKYRPDISPYAFSGQNFYSAYTVDVKTGEFYTNESSAKNIPPNIKDNKFYKMIFGEKNYKVFPTKDGMNYRIKENFANMFEGNIDPQTDQAFFQFGFAKTNWAEEVRITLVFRYGSSHEEEEWQLNTNTNNYLDMRIPQLFQDHFLGWSCLKRGCILFRKPSLTQMGSVGLIVHFQRESILKALLVTRKNSKLHIQDLVMSDTVLFDEIVLRSEKQKKSLLPFQILSTLQDPKFIIELFNLKTCKAKFWLHRYDLNCIQDSHSGLTFENFQDYQIYYSYKSCKYLPWDSSDTVSCLILQKISNSQSTDYMDYLHNFKVILPKQKFYYQSEIQQKKQANEEHQFLVNSLKKLTFYKYNLHDHFHRLSSHQRQSQLHLVAVIVSLKSNAFLNEVMLTKEQYAIKLLYSCFNNCALTLEEFKIMEFVLKNAENFSNTIFLLGHALIMMTKQLITVGTDFDDQSARKAKYHYYLSDPTYCLKVSFCIGQYNKSIRNGLINHRNVIPQHIADVIGLKFIKVTNFSKQKQLTWSQSHPLLISLQNEILENYLKYFKGTLSDYQALKINILASDGYQGMEEQNNLGILIKKGQKVSELGSEVFKQLEKSCDAYTIVKKEIDSIEISKQWLEYFCTINEQLKENKLQIEEVFCTCNQSSKKHLDVITNYRPQLSKFDYVGLLTGEISLKDFYPQINQEISQKIYELLRCWMLYTVQLDSCKRIISHLSRPEKIDKIVLLRELQSPRYKIQENIFWVCFQAEMKIQIWKSQYDAYEHLINNSSLYKGPVCQLNMGEGKTQVIIPMIVLELLYGSHKNKGFIPRINLLSAIFNESKANYYTFFSVSSFNIPLIELPFEREVQIAHRPVLNKILTSLSFHKKKLVLLLNESNVNSMILKFRECAMSVDGFQNINKETSIFKKIKCYDIFDEVDAQMTPKKTFIYSIGNSDQLDLLDFRVTLPAYLIEIICKHLQQFQDNDLIVFDEASKCLDQGIKQGKFPKGLRLVSNIHENAKKKSKFRKILASHILSAEERPGQLIFLSDLSTQILQKIQKYLVEEDYELAKNVNILLSEQANKMIYCIRGLLAFGILEHTLAKKCRIDFGAPDKQRLKRTGKRIAIPYEAADIPSKKNDYAQPDVTIFFSYLCYLNIGISFENVCEVIDKLFEITQGSTQARNKIYKSWHDSLDECGAMNLKINMASQINKVSLSQRIRLFEAFHLNRKFISFWLKYCVFPQDMLQFQFSISSSSWDYSYVENSLGFSGTKDLHWLFPHYLQYQQSHNQSIRGTDGKMVQMLFQHTLGIHTIEDADKPLWERFLETCMQLPKKYNLGSIIDVGAILGGTSLSQTIVPWIAKHPQFNNREQFKGISYCSNNHWKVYQLCNLESLKRGSTILDHETFVIFDEYRTRGADMKMDSNISAVISLSPFLTKDSLMQAIGRLRKIGRNQKIVILTNSQIKKKITEIIPSYSDKMPLKQQIQSIMKWTCFNSINQNERFLYENSKLAKEHLKNKILAENRKKPEANKQETDLYSMYAHKIEMKSVHQLTQNLFKEIEVSIKNREEIRKVKSYTEKFGKKVYSKAQELEDIRERETEAIQEQQKVHDETSQNLEPIPESDTIQENQVKLSALSYAFSKKFKISSNFINCTTKPFQLTTENDNQLAFCFFVRMSAKSICLITIRQANLLIAQQMMRFYVKSIEVDTNSCYVARLKDLQLEDAFIENHGLEQALVHCKFFSGQRNFSENQEKLLRRLLSTDKISIPKISYFLSRRRIDNYFKNSTLQNLYNNLLLLTETQIKKMQKSG